MSSFLIPTNLRAHVAAQIKESLLEAANTAYYVFAGRHEPTANGAIPVPEDKVQEFLYDSYDNMVFGKRLVDADVSMMIPRVEWVTNTVYTAYDSANVVFGSNFYCAVATGSSYDVFKVLDNKDGTPSTSAPDLNETSPTDSYYSTADGYVWKYMYSISLADWTKFATDNWMPVTSNTEVAAAAVPGAIDLIRIDSGGSNYNALVSNTFATSQIAVGGNPLNFELPSYASSNNSFYNDSGIYIVSGPGAGEIRRIVAYNGAFRRITIDSPFVVTPTSSSPYEITPIVIVNGNGSGSKARALINTASSNSVYKVEIIQRGQDYSYAGISLGGNTSGVANDAVLTAVLSPKGGHGANSIIELGASAVGIGMKFANSESGVIPTTNDYRTIGIIENPLYANVQLSVNASSVVGVFSVGANISQDNTNAIGVVTNVSGTTLTLSNVAGIFLTGLPVRTTGNTAVANVISYEINTIAKNFSTFDQRSRFAVSYISGTFIEDEPVYQNNAVFANGVFHSNDATYLSLTKVKGTFNAGEPIVGSVSGATANVLSRVPPDLVPYSGDVFYIENTDAIARSNTQSEQIKIVLKF